MAESEVENILREIRERVLAQQQAGDHDIRASHVGTSNGNEGNGASSYGSSMEVVHQGDPENLAAENSALIGSYLTTTARAWDRLPPLVSNRSGLAASIELWVKRKMKRATRWYIWEQVNFNAAVHHALRDMLQMMVSYERELGNLRTRFQTEKDVRHAEFAKHEAEVTARLEDVRVELGELGSQLGELRQSLFELQQERLGFSQELQGLSQELQGLSQQLPALRAEIGGTRVELETDRAHAEAERAQTLARQTAAQTHNDELNVQLAQVSSRIADLASELREGDERVQAAQQVSFRQLSLEISEAAVMEDRARRKTQSLLEELTLRIKSLENN